MTLLVIVLLTAFVLLGINYVFPWFVRWYQVHRWNQVTGQIALTYDDGPDLVTSVALLDLLDEYEVPATFYLVGFRAEQCPDVVSRLARSNHQLGSHSHNHRHPWKIAPWVELKDAAEGIETLEELLPEGAAYRPPFGKISLITMIMLWLRGSSVHWWCFDTKDTDERHPNPEDVADAIVSSSRPVVLMHCHHYEDNKREYVLRLTRAIIERASFRNIEFVTMEDLKVDS